VFTTTNGNLLFGSTFDGGNRDVTIAGSVGTGTVTFVGAVTNVGTAAGTSFVVQGGQTGLVRFQGTVNGVSGFSLADGTSVRFDDDVTLTGGDTGNSFLGNVVLDGLTFTSSQAVQFGNSAAGDQLTLSGGAVVVSTAAANQPVTFTCRVDGGQALTVNAGSANTLFNGAVGGTTALASLTTDAGGTTQINGGGVTTTGAQTYNDAVLLGANTTLTTTSGTVQFGQDLSGAFTLTINGGTGNVTFSSTIGGGADPTGISITTAGNITFTGAVNIGGAVTISAANVSINSGIYASAAGNVQITNSGTLTILDTTSPADDTTADINILGSFTQLSGGGGSSVSIQGDIVTSAGNSITFNSPLTLTGNVLLQANGAGNISLLSTVNPTTDSNEGLRFYTDSGTISVTGPVGRTSG
jgi:hypothetical protein